MKKVWLVFDYDRQFCGAFATKQAAVETFYLDGFVEGDAGRKGTTCYCDTKYYNAIQYFLIEAKVEE